jgi:hypothetical protein
MSYSILPEGLQEKKIGKKSESACEWHWIDKAKQMEEKTKTTTTKKKINIYKEMSEEVSILFLSFVNYHHKKKNKTKKNCHRQTR